MDKKSKFAFEQMEPRLLFSADLDGGLVSGGPVSHAALLDPALTQELAPPAGADGETRVVAEIRQELVLVDTDTPDYQQLIDDLLANEDESRQLEVILLDNTRDGIHQVTEILSNYNGLDAVHLISHGSEGTVDLGGGRLEFESLKANASLVKSWGEAFTANGDFLIYGCDLAATADGQSLVNALGRLTGADVAASDDLTGNAALGGDWALEYSTGNIETAVAVSQNVQQNWGNVLLTFNVNTNADTVVANLGDTTGADAAGNISLRAAIQEANFQFGAHTIFLPADTYNLSGGSGENFAAMGDLDIRSDITIVGAGAGTTIIDANSVDRVFHLTTAFADLALQDLTVTGGSVSGGNGGGIFVDTAVSQLQLIRVIVEGNTADNGGGIYNRGSMILLDVVIENNGDLATTVVGGGINNAGGAILDRVTINNNRAGDGGGIFNASPAFTLSLTNVTVSGNEASGKGGGLLAEGDANIGNSTFTLNTASNGGGISENGGIVYIKNSIVAENTAGTGPDIEGNINSFGYNLIGDRTGSTGGIGTDLMGTSGSPIDPQLGGLALNGGITRNHALLAGSPAIDAGTNSGVPPTDQRGVGRPFDGDGDLTATTDIGAFEFNGVSTSAALWFSTIGNGDTGSTAWNDQQVVQFSDPNMKFEPSGSTDGTFSLLPGFTAPYDIRAMHLVGSNITIGTTGNQTSLQAGDLLLTLDPGNNNEVTVGGLTFDRQDILLFRPTVAGDYSSGTYSMLLDEGIHDASTVYNSHAFTLVETDTTVGATLLQAGTFIVARSTPAEHDNLYVVNVTGTGSGTGPGGTQTDDMQLLLDGDPLGFSNLKIQGLELIEQTTTIGGETLVQGTLLMTLETNSPVTLAGSVDVEQGDIFTLDPSLTTVTLLFEGSDVGLEAAPAENINALTLINGSIVANSPAVIGGVDTGSVTEDVDPDLDGLLEAGGALTVSDADAFEDNFTAETVVGTYGSLTIDATGNWSYAADNTQAAIQNLAAAATLTDTLTVSSVDGTTHAVVITITGANDAAVIGGVDTGAVTEDVDPDLDALLETGGALTITDTDTGEASFTAGTVAGTYGSLTIDATGNWSYAADNTQAAIQSLDAGESLNDTLTVTTTGGTTHNVVITINGAEDALVIGGVDTGSVTEDVAVTAGNLTASGALTISDVDTSDNPVSFNAGTIVGSYGDLTIDAAGNWSYSALNSQAAIQSLAAGTTMTDTLTVTTSDSSTHAIVITFTGTNDVPLIGGDVTGNVNENVDPDLDGLLEDSGTLTISDIDTGESNFTAATIVGTYGDLTIDAAGNWSYAADNAQAAIQALMPSDTLTDTLTVTTADGTTFDVVVTIRGTNKPAVITGDNSGAVTEDVDPDLDGLLEDSGILVASDPDIGESAFIAGTVAGSYGNLTIDAAGNWTYAADNTQAVIQNLAAGATLTDTLTVSSVDGTTQDVIITITGANDAALIGGVDTGSVTEDVDPDLDGLLETGGALTISDIETGEASFTAGTLTGTYGNLTIDAAGNWSYTADNSQAVIQNLAVGVTLVDTLTVTSVDGTTRDVVVVITGANDAPTVANPNPYQAATVDALFSSTFALNTFNDVDGDTLTFTATQGDGSALPGWLSFDAATRTLSGTPVAADIGVITVRITANDGNGGSVSDVFNLNISVTPGGPVVIVDVPDPGPDIEPAPDPEVIDPPTGTTDPEPGDGEDPGADPGLPGVGGAVTPVPDPGAGNPVPPVEPAPDTERPGDPKNTIPAEPGPQVKYPNTTADFNYGRAGMTAKALMRVSAFVQELDDARQMMSEKATIEQRIVGSTMTVTTGLSVGYVIWLIRGGVLLSSVLSSLPAWAMIDPLPVLAFTRRRSEDDEDDESLESMVSKGGRAARPQRDPADEDSAGDLEENEETE